MERFDLNINKVLEDWDSATAIREFIANAIDESFLTGTRFPEVTFENGLCTIRDWGRGIQKKHFVFDKDPEKENNSNVIGKFGYGLKDAIAVLYRNQIDLQICSSHLTARFEVGLKHETDVKVIHAILSPPEIPVGTEIHIPIDREVVEKAKGYFLYFSPVRILESTDFGQVLVTEPNQKIPIYINGMRVTEETPDHLAFGYNITNLDTSIRKNLNRERKDLNWSVYSSQVINILNCSTNNEFIVQTLLDRYNQGKRDHELAKTKNKMLKKIVENTPVAQIPTEEATPTVISDMQQSGIQFQFVTPQDAEINRELKAEGVKVKDHIWVHETVSAERTNVISVISEPDLTPDEMKILELYKPICNRLGYMNHIRPIINQDNSEWVGLWKGSDIYITRNQLKSKETFLGTYLHEMTHYETGALDNTLKFENGLTNVIGQLAKLLV